MIHLNKNEAHLFVLERGEKLVGSLTEALLSQEIQAATISGLGALTEVELGFYELSKKDYLRKTFNDEYELISLTGNVTLKDGKPFVHVHAALGDEHFQVFGGHLFEAVTAVTVEVSLLPFDFVPERRVNSAIGLSLICGLAP